MPSSPLRPEVIRFAIVLLFTTGIRRGELLRLTLGDYDRRNATLLIRESKFHKSRLLPLNSDIAKEMDRYLAPDQLKVFCLPRHSRHRERHQGRTGLQRRDLRSLPAALCSGNARSSPRRGGCHGFMISS